MANGQIERRASERTGKVTWRVRWVDANGKRRSRSFDRRAQAKEFLARQQGRVADAKIGRPQRPRGADDTLAKASETWLKTRPAKRVRDDSPHLEHHIVPYLGPHTVDEIASDQALQRAFVRHLESKHSVRKGQKTKRKLSPATIRSILLTFNRMMHDLGYPQVSLRYKVPEQPYSWIRDPKAIPRFLAEAPEWFRVAAALAVYAGLRKGEVAGLQRDDIDWERGLIHVRRSYDGPTKNYALRAVPLAPELAAILKPWLLRTKGAHVAVRPDGEPITPDYVGVTQLARRISRKLDGCDAINYHSLRHTYASHLALAGVPLLHIGRLLGHKTPAMVTRYAHLSAESLAHDPRTRLSFGSAPEGEVVEMPRQRDAKG